MFYTEIRKILFKVECVQYNITNKKQLCTILILHSCFFVRKTLLETKSLQNVLARSIYRETVNLEVCC